MNKAKKAAHFLLLPELLYSPPNHAIVNSLIQLGYEVYIFAPNIGEISTEYGKKVFTHNANYSFSWLLKHLISLNWYQFSLFSSTSEDPFAVVFILSLLYGTPYFLLVDEIKAGSYRGDRSEKWKQLCKLAIKNSKFSIVNDESRIKLLRDYAQLSQNQTVIVYPGCFYEPPVPTDGYRNQQREKWGFSDESTVIASSGGFNLTAGADWLLQSLQDRAELCSVIQPLGVDPLSMFLLKHFSYDKRVYLQKERLSWRQAWLSAVGFDIGLAIYHNQAPQFQQMGISSNRLCMYIAMGVPVICSEQPSFRFVEDYNCGVMVNDYRGFLEAIDYIVANIDSMKSNCQRCLRNYISPFTKYKSLVNTIQRVFSPSHFT